MVMSLERCSGRFFLAALGGLVLSACSEQASTAVPPVQSAAPTRAVATAPAPVSAPLVTGLPDFTALVDHYGPAVVNVQVTEDRQRGQRGERGGPEGMNPNDPFGDFFRRFGIPNPQQPQQPRNQPPARGVGSGFIVSEDGYIMTNAHVVRDASEVVVKMTDRREYTAKVIGIDDRTDVAVIKIEAKNLPTVRIGDPASLKPGQWVVAIGSPFGMENSVTAGIVSATARTLPSDMYVPFIQTDVAVNPGNSGGPLFNLSGEVVGINSQIYSQSGGYMGLSFAIPIDVANNVRMQLITKGKVTRSKIGVQLDQMDAALAESFGLDRPRGAPVSSVIAGGPAEKAGLKEGDIIIGVDGRKIESDVELPSVISAIPPGKTTELEIWRDRSARKITVRVVEMEEDGATSPSVSGRGGSATEPSSLGLSVRPLDPAEKQQADTQGSLVVEDVTGPAARAGIQPGDIILGVNGTRVRTAAELAAAVGKRTGRYVSLLVQRGGNQSFVQVRVE
jgi:serine protease Do